MGGYKSVVQNSGKQYDVILESWGGGVEINANSIQLCWSWD